MTHTNAQKNVAVFGPAHAGKSSLVGYLTVRTSVDPNDWQRMVLGIQRELGSEYLAAQKFAYVVDTGKEERTKQSVHSGMGTSKEMHTAALTLHAHGAEVPLSILDTPGTPMREREQYVGMYLGDIGIFVIEAPKIIKHGWSDPEAVRKFFAPLIAWAEFKSNCAFSVVLSKFDQCDFQEESFIKASEIVTDIIGSKRPSDLSIIPIALDIASEEDVNILAKSTRTPWYRGDSLIAWIASAIETPRLGPPLSRNKLCCLEGSFPKQAEAAGVPLLLRGKVLFGDFAVGEEVQIAPVREPGGTFHVTKAKIRSLRHEKREGSDSLTLNDIGGFGLVLPRGHRNLEMSRSTCIFGGTETIALGNCLSVHFLNENVDLDINEKMTLIWFGKLVEVVVIGYRTNLPNEIVVESVEGPFALSQPLDSAAHERFYFRRKQDDKRNQPDKMQFLECKIASIGKALNLRLNAVSTVGDETSVLRRGGFQVVEDSNGATWEYACGESSGRVGSETAADYLRRSTLSRRVTSGHVSIELKTG